MNTTVASIITAALVVVPIVLIIGLWRKRSPHRVDWLITAALTTGFVGYVLLAGRWDTSSYYLRPLVGLAFVAALAISLTRVRKAPWWTAPKGVGGWIALGVNAAIAVLFVGLFALAVSGVSPGPAAVALSNPLRSGVSYVGQGGASTWLNYHHASRAQAYAVDVIGLNPAGRHATGLHPTDPGAYVIFGRPVHSPCRGTVLEVRSDLPDLRPPATDRENLAGNHLVIRCQGTDPAVDVLLAHLQQGSVTLARGAQVQDGQVVGRVGNTGNTSEPHLHVHAVRTGSGDVLDGVGVPIRFDGRFWLRNDLLFGAAEPGG